MSSAQDNDGDGFDSGSDCDDNDPSINNGADEYCDGIDNNCDGLIDTNPVDGMTYYLDDGDGYGTPDEVITVVIYMMDIPW